VNVVLFDTVVHSPFPGPVPATAANIQTISQFVTSAHPQFHHGRRLGRGTRIRIQWCRNLDVTGASHFLHDILRLCVAA